MIIMISMIVSMIIMTCSMIVIITTVYYYYYYYYYYEYYAYYGYYDYYYSQGALLRGSVFFFAVSRRPVSCTWPRPLSSSEEPSRCVWGVFCCFRAVATICPRNSLNSA